MDFQSDSGPSSSDRYSRHVLLPQVGIDGVQRLSSSSVICVGAGGLGSPALLYLAAAGIGNITIIDDDKVELSNLQRQIIHQESDIGKLKVESAKEHLLRLNSAIDVTIYPFRLDESNALEILSGHDVVIDGTDNIETRYLIDDSCKSLDIPWIYASVYRFEGHLSVFNHHSGPTYRDVFPTAPPPELIPSCAEAGVLGVLPGVMGSLQATEAIKIILNLETPLSGQMLIYDGLQSTFRTLVISPQNKKNRQVQEEKASPTEVMMHTIDAPTAGKKLDEGWSPFILDVRSKDEFNAGHIDSVDFQITHENVLSAIEHIPKDRDVLVYCARGKRSELAIYFLMHEGYSGENLYNLEGGFMSWKDHYPNRVNV